LPSFMTGFGWIGRRWGRRMCSGNDSRLMACSQRGPSIVAAPRPFSRDASYRPPIPAGGNSPSETTFCCHAASDSIAGSRALRLSLQNGITRVEEVWFTNRMRLHFGNAIRIGDTMFGANGDFGPSFVTAVNMADGSVLWRDRSFAKASFLLADGKLIVLDEDGVLGLARVTPTGMQVLSRADVFRSRSWTVPTLAGTVLYARDLQEIAAFDVSAAANPRH